MALRRRLASASAALRVRAARLTERVEALPKPPFAVAVVAAVALLIAGLAVAPDPDRRVSEVGMFVEPSPDDAAGIDADAQVEPAEVEIVEYGFGLTVQHDREWLTVGAVVHNSHPTAVAHLTLEITGVLQGEPWNELLSVTYTPPDSDALIGRRLSSASADRVDELALTLRSVSFDEPFIIPSRDHLPARFDVLEIEPLISPPGHRFVYRIESELDHHETIRLDVVFRDAGGAIVGGIDGDDQAATDASSSIRVPLGTSIHHFHLRSEEIPAGADLSRTEIGPGGSIPGAG